jgi:hypothetical protein
LKGRSDKEPVKDIITMMREFQAETNRYQTISTENNSTTIDPVTANEQTIPDKQQIISDDVSNQSNINVNISESRTITDRNKLNTKSISRLTSDTLSVRFVFSIFLSNIFIFSQQDVQIMIHIIVY